jgi:hypothetical protein
MLRKRITFANVTSLLALFVALSATSYAAIVLPANSVGPKQLKAKAVTAPKIKANAINGSKIANGSLTAADLSPATLAKVPAASSADSAPIARLQIVSADGTNSPAPASGGVDVKGATATCPTGMYAIGGGVHVSDSSSQAMNDSHPAGLTAWSGEAYNAGGGTPSFTVSAVCAPAATTA